MLELVQALESLRDALVGASLHLKDLQLDLNAERRAEIEADCRRLLEKAKSS